MKLEFSQIKKILYIFLICFFCLEIIFLATRLEKRIFSNSAQAEGQQELVSIPQTCPTTLCNQGYTCKQDNCVQCGNPEDIFPPIEESSLREYASKRGLIIGTTIQYNKWDLDDEYKPVLAKEFSSGVLFAFMSQVEPSQGQFNFSKIDSVIEFSKENSIRLIGGSLIYGSSTTPNSWLGFHQDDCGGWSKGEVDEIMKDYIQTTMSHVGDSAYAWKVVNEPLTETMKNSCWSKKLGGVEKILESENADDWKDNYIAKAFKYAHEANPNLLLILNDHFWTGGVELQKTNEFMTLIQRLKSVGVPIHAAGIEMHLEADKLRSDYQDEFRYFLKKAEELGVQVHVTEMDVYQDQSGLERQKEIFKNIMAICLENFHCTNFTTWGLTDKYSWLRTRENNPLPDAQPLFFDENYQRKPAYYGVIEALRENTTRSCRKYHVEDSPFGITARELSKVSQREHWLMILEHLNDIGVKKLRFFVNWFEIEPENDQWDDWRINFYSERLKDLKNHGVEPYIVISNGFPDWAMRDDHKACGETQENWGTATCHYPPKDINEWNEFVAKIVDTWGYGSNGKELVRQWEILWEENAGWDTPAGYFYDHPEEYVNLLKNSYETIKTIDPSAKTVFGRLLHQPPYSREFLNKILDLGGENYFDIFNFGGTYRCGLVDDFRNRIKTYRSILADNGYDKEIWATEVHCASDVDIDGETDPEGEQIQASNLTGLFNVAIEENITMFWQSYRDRVDMPVLGKRASGLVRDDYSEKPAYYAYKEIATGEGVTPTSTPTSTPPQSCPDEALKGDYNCDGAVNLHDFEVWKSDYLQNNATLSFFEYWRRAFFSE